METSRLGWESVHRYICATCSTAPTQPLHSNQVKLVKQLTSTLACGDGSCSDLLVHFMPARDCAACFRPILRTPGNSVLCTRCLRLFHFGCLNSGSTSVGSVCVTCEASFLTSTATVKPTGSFPSTLDISEETVSYFQGLIAPVPTYDRQIPLEPAPTPGKRPPTSPPECPSPLLKTFCQPISPPASRSVMSTDGPQIPEGTLSWAVPLYQHTVGIRNELATLSAGVQVLVYRIQTIEQDVSYLSEKTNAMQLSGAYRDTCEVRISGIPYDFLSNSQQSGTAVNSVLTTMECPEAAKYINKIRPFSAKSDNTASVVGSAAVQFTCTAARDDVLASGRKLKSQTSNKLLGRGGDTSIFVNPILPAPIHKLGAAARERAHVINYPRPLVNSAGVFMKRNLLIVAAY